MLLKTNIEHDGHQGWGRQLSLSVFVFLMSCAWFSSHAEADETNKGPIHAIRVGALNHDVGGLWSGFRREDGLDLNVEAQFNFAVPVFYGNLRPALGASINTEGDTSKAYLGARWEVVFWEESVFFGVGLGAAVHDGNTGFGRNDKKALGSRVLFHIPAELGVYLGEHISVSLFFDHVSNAYLADENQGLDTLGFRVGYRF